MSMTMLVRSTPRRSATPAMAVAPQGISFGIKTSQMGLSYAEAQRVWCEADQLPMFEHARLWDHMIPLRVAVRADALEDWTLRAALSAQSTRLRVGVIVTGYRLRSP